MDYEQLQKYQRSLLERALTEGIRRNEEQTQVWSDYKVRHEKVIESLENFSQELMVECMVPIGKKALMRGKLIHTNEILVCLGEGYFAKYSARQALALCKRAESILASLEKERNLYEMRQRIPECFDAFGSEERQDMIEHWEEKKLQDWRIEHREREKEYKKKLLELKNTEKQDIKTEEDLFAKLDALELQEELEEELHRLEAERPDFYSQDLNEGEVYEESSGSSDESEEESDDDEINSENQTASSENIVSLTDDKSETPESDSSVENSEISKETSESSVVASADSRRKSVETPTIETTKVEETREKRVAFGEPHVKYFNEEERIGSPDKREETNKDSDDDDSSDDSIVRIEFKHSDYEPDIVERDGEESFTSPRDFYRILSKPISILKNCEASPIRAVHNVLPVNDNTDDDIDDDPAGISAYNTIVRDVREYVIDKPSQKRNEPVAENRPVSKFKRERMKK